MPSSLYVFQIRCGAAVHVVIVEVLSRHCPDERIVLCCAGGMYAPFGGDDRLAVLHPDMACLVRLSHEVADGLVIRNLEVEIDLHAAVVRMCRHGVPCAPRLELGHAHLKLASRDDLLDEHPVDYAVVALLEGSEFHPDGILPCGEMVWICGVCRCGAEIEFCRIGRIEAFESYLPVAASEVEGLLVFHRIRLIPGLHESLAADIEYSHFPAGKEIFAAENVHRFQFQNLVDRHRPSGNHPVMHGVHQIDLIRGEDLLHKIVFPQPGRVIMLHIVRMGSISNFAVDFHIVAFYISP